MNDDLDLRASEGDREATAAALRHHHAEGRLDTDEFEARIGRCYGATATRDLHELVADLPVVPRAAQRIRSRRLAPLRVVAAAALGSVPVLGILITLTGPHMLWLAAIPAWIALSRHDPMGCRHGLSHLGRAPRMRPSLRDRRSADILTSW